MPSFARDNQCTRCKSKTTFRYKRSRVYKRCACGEIVVFRTALAEKHNRKRLRAWLVAKGIVRVE